MPLCRDEAGSGSEGLMKKFVSAFKRKSHLRSEKSQSSLRTITSAASLTLTRGASKLSEVAPSLNLMGDVPHDEELEAMFIQVMEDSGMPRDRLTPLFLAGKSRQDRWEIVKNSGKLQELRQGRSTVRYFISVLGENMDRPNELEHVELLKQETASSLRIQLSNQPLSWITEFIDFGGAKVLAKGLRDLYFTPNFSGKSEVTREWLWATRAFTNNAIGLYEAANNQELLNSLSLYTNHVDPDVALIPLHIYTVSAYSNPPEAVVKIIAAMSYLQSTLEEENRFDSFIKYLTMECRVLRGLADESSPCKSRTLIVDGLLFINAILDNLEDCEMRIHIRNQIYRRPLRAELDALRNCKDQAILRQLNIFWAILNNDTEWMMEQYQVSITSPSSDPEELFRVLQTSLQDCGGSEAITSLLQHLLCVRNDPAVRVRHVKLLDKTLEHILLHNKGVDPDFYASPLPYLTSADLERILNTNEVEALKAKVDGLQLQVLAMEEDKKQAVKVLSEDTVILLEQIKGLKQQLEFSLQEAGSKFDCANRDLASQLDTLQMELKRERELRANVERELDMLKMEPPTPTVVKISTIDEGEDKAEETLTLSNAEGQPTQEESGFAVQDDPNVPTEHAKFAQPLNDLHAAPVLALPPPPPPMPPNSVAPAPAPPPPPPPSKGRVGSVGSPVKLAKAPGSLNIPESLVYPMPKNKLKAVQWRKIFPKDLKGSIWESYDPAMFQKKVDFERVDFLFSAMQSPESKSPTSPKPTETSPLVDLLPSTQRISISILLNKIPHTEDVLMAAIESMDDSIFIPRLAMAFKKIFYQGRERKDEMLNLLEMVGKEEVSFYNITDPLERLLVKLARSRALPVRLLFICDKTQFTDALQVSQRLLEPFVECFQKIKSSERLGKICWLALYIGNYLNQGSNRGEALGFTLESINSFKPIRGSEPDTTLLTFLLETIRREFPDYAEILGELTMVKSITPTKFNELEESYALLSTSCQNLKQTVAMYREFKLLLPDSPMEIDEESDSFMVHAKIPSHYLCYAFVQQAEYSLKEMLAKRATMEEEKDALVKYFVGDGGAKTETIFAVFNEFLTDFETSKVVNEKRELLALREKRMQHVRGREGRSSITGFIQESSHSQDRGLVDNVLKSLRDGPQEMSVVGVELHS